MSNLKQEKAERREKIIDILRYPNNKGTEWSSTAKETRAQQADQLESLIEAESNRRVVENLENIISVIHVYMDSITPPGGEWPDVDALSLVAILEARISQLKGGV